MKKLEEELKNFSVKNSHIRCTAHIINLAVQAFLEELKAEATHEDEDEITENPVPQFVIPKVFYFYFYFKFNFI